MQFVLAEPEMNDAIRCQYFANAIAQRKLIRIFSLSALRVREQWGEGRGEAPGNWWGERPREPEPIPNLCGFGSRGRSPHQLQPN